MSPVLHECETVQQKADAIQRGEIPLKNTKLLRVLFNFGRKHTQTQKSFKILSGGYIVIETRYDAYVG